MTRAKVEIGRETPKTVTTTYSMKNSATNASMLLAHVLFVNRNVELAQILPKDNLGLNTLVILNLGMHTLDDFLYGFQHYPLVDVFQYFLNPPNS
jgi:hypothetical protein